MSIQILKIKFNIFSFLMRYLLSLAVFIILFLPVALTLANHYWGNYPNQGILWMSGEKGYNGHVWVTSTHCFLEETSAYVRIKESTTGTYEMSRWPNGIQMVPITCDGDIDNNPSIDIKLDYQENYQNDPEHGTEGGHNHSTLALPGYCAAWDASYPCGTRSTVHLNKPKWDTKSFTWRERLIMHETGHSHRLDHHCNSDSIMNDGNKSCNGGKWEQIMAYQPTDRTGINSIYSTYVSGIISQNTTWKRAYSPYIVQGTLTVNSGVTLTIEPGVVVKFQSTTSSLVVNGTLQVNGTSTTNVYFTSFKDDSIGGDTNSDGSASLPAAQNWQYIQFNSGSTGNISNAVVRYAGYSYGNGIYNNGGTLNISNSQIADNASNGISQTSGASTITFTEFNNQNYGAYAIDGDLTLNNNTFNNNSSATAYISGPVNFTHSGNTATGTGLRGFLMSGIGLNQTWTAGDLPYIISNLGVDPANTLTLDPGVVVKFDYSSPSYLNIYGTLQVNGLSTNKVYFTSLKDDAVGGDTNGDGIATSPTVRDWNQIQFNPGSTGNISNAIIRYGGNSSCCPAFGAGLYNYGGTLNVTNSQIAYNSFTGIYQYLSGTLTITSSEFNNQNYGVRIDGGTATVLQSNFYDNTSYGLYNATANLIIAENNYWSSPSGPYHPILNPGGTGNRVSDNVDFDPWLISWP